MTTSPSALQPQIVSPPPPENPHLPALGTPRNVADELNPDQLTARATTFTPELRALFAESGHGESVLND